MNESQWFIRRNNDVQGPLSLQELSRLVQQGLVKPGTPVSSDKSTWHDAATIEGLFSGQAGPAHGTSRPIAKDLLKSGKSQVSAVVSDLRQMDLRSEIIPIDASNLAILAKDFVFWATALLGVVPLLIVTLSDNQSQLTAFALFFAALWGVIFKLFVLRHGGSWKLPVVALFFTGTAGMYGLLFVYRHFLPEAYLAMSSSQSHLTSLFGFVARVGLFEELCKIVPVVGYLIWKRSNADPFMIVLIGIFSGLGFAAFENLSYGEKAVLRSYDLANSYGAEGLVAGVQSAMVVMMLRSLSAVFSHAVWSGTFAYFLAAAFVSKRRWGALFLVGLGVSALLHGAYDWLLGVQPTMTALTAGASFVLFYGYVAKLRGAIAARSGQPVTEE